MHAMRLNRNSTACALATIILTATTLCGGCGIQRSTLASTTTTRSTVPPPPGTPSPPESTPQHVCAQFGSTLLALDGRTNLSPADARALAAHRYGSPTLASHLRGAGDDPEWQQLRHQQAHITPVITPVADDPPLATNTTAAAAVTAHRTAITPDGHHQNLASMVVYCALHAYPQRGWEVVDLRLTADDPTATPPPVR